MKRFQSLGNPWSLNLGYTLAKNEFSLMEQGTVLGFTLAFCNNVVMLLVFHTLFVERFLHGVPNPWVYLLLGIVQWNLYMNASLAGFGSLVYRQKLVMGYSFPKEILILARTAAVFVPYIIELSLILCIAAYFQMFPREKFFQIPILILSEYFFCAGLGFIFAFIGVVHKNIVPFWNIMFRLLSFATPIFYLPAHFSSKWADIIFSWNPFTIFMLWIRDIVGANGFDVPLSMAKIFLGSIAVFLFGYFIFRKSERKIGDCL
ncbi:MAG: ABC transporter permease [Oligoflexia bacterium]|nr:ABC transporter permease [Oligoflexia bacterium]